MPRSQLAKWATAFAVFLSGALAVLPVVAATNTAKTPAASSLDNATCQTCHDGKKGKLEGAGADGEKRELREIATNKYGQSVHAKMQCVACHANITDTTSPHKKSATPTQDCAQCHQALWDKAKQDGTGASQPRMETIAKNIEAYNKSFHARPDKDNPKVAKATCTQCHDTHAFNVPADPKSPAYAAWRKETPALCGQSCHEEQIETFNDSIHGKEAVGKGNIKAPVCTTCHTTHEITNTSLTSFKLLNNEDCGGCHKDRLSSYRDTYHGQVTKLGYPDTAKCYNCHGSHGILSAKDPKSKVHVDNRLKTCKECHDGKKRALATAGFATFGPHANSHDFAKYPQLWIATKFMQALLIGVFAFFWLHSGLWYYREWKDRKDGKTVAHVRTAGLPREDKQFFQRFSLGWRVAHLAFALITMALVLTGTSALFSHTAWAPVVARALGGASGLALIHRVAAALFVAIFFIHFVYVMQGLLRSKTFRWFGPDSLIPNWKDLADCVGMFKWFLGMGPKPRFDRWAYYEKFDYWAVFWGVTIIGTSGLMMAIPTVTASFLPGWVLNVAKVVHGEEAFLAAVFLFTVHFFNNHFRPDKLPPPDIVMFTGTQSLEEFRADHPAQYQRLVDSGELEKHLVDGPSRPMALGSKILGLALIAVGLVLLVLVIHGFLSSM
ncbi:cytochrome c3 family protein [Rhodoferax sp.]|uniref:cytochrome c3 family protein n=1 Tax=Rhodoferax sp. TaxID=50421 RepID=UPI00275A3F54|nr:cytochrome C [Rhodoferax sp.]